MILIKRLTKSDLTLIERLRLTNLKQEAIVFRKEFMSQLGSPYDEHNRGHTLPLNMTFWGPGQWGALPKSGAAIRRHSNDWRLQECSISELDNLDGRFEALEPDGSTIFVFSINLNTTPAIGNGLFVSGHVDDDKMLHKQLDALLDERDWEVIAKSELRDLIGEGNLPDGHALFGFFGDADFGSGSDSINERIHSLSLQNIPKISTQGSAPFF